MESKKIRHTFILTFHLTSSRCLCTDCVCERLMHCFVAISDYEFKKLHLDARKPLLLHRILQYAGTKNSLIGDKRGKQFTPTHNSSRDVQKRSFVRHFNAMTLKCNVVCRILNEDSRRSLHLYL